MASHHVMKPVRHASDTPAAKQYLSGGAIVEGAVVVLSGGKVVEATDDDAGALGEYVGVALESAAAANEFVMVHPCLAGERFIVSLTDVAAAAGSDGGTKALALADIGTLVEIHKDNTTLKFVAGATGGADAAARVVALIDKVGATTVDARTFGAVGTADGITTEPGPIQNSGKALVEIVFVQHNGTKVKTIW